MAPRFVSCGLLLLPQQTEDSVQASRLRLCRNPATSEPGARCPFLSLLLCWPVRAPPKGSIDSRSISKSLELGRLRLCGSCSPAARPPPFGLRSISRSQSFPPDHHRTTAEQQSVGRRNRCPEPRALIGSFGRGQHDISPSLREGKINLTRPCVHSRPRFFFHWRLRLAVLPLSRPLNQGLIVPWPRPFGGYRAA